MRKVLLLALSILLLAPALAQAANAQAQEYDELGMSLYRQGLYAKAITYFQNAVQADPTDWEGYENLGNAYFKINDNADALSAYQKSLQINPNNSTLENIVQSMQGNTAPAAANARSNSPADTQPAVSQPPMGAAPPTAPQSSVDSEQPIDNGQSNPSAMAPPQPGTTVVVRHRHRLYAQQAPVYNDNLAPMDHRKIWVDADLAYNWSNQQDFFTGASNENNFIKQNGYTGTASADNSGLEGGVELGFLLNPYNGIAIGVRGIVSNPYISNVNYQNGGDFETVNVQPYVVPLTLDYYFFMPDHDGRFFLTAGIGYYFVDVAVNDNYSYANATPAGPTDELMGDMYGGTVGFQAGVGREFEIGPRLGLRIFARGRYAKISNINGTFTSFNGVTDNYGLVSAPYLGNSISVDSTSNIGGNEHYATLDYTGFDLGIGLTFF